MKEDYGFFNSKDHDRVYNAKDWADYFFPFFRTGVFNGHLQIVENEGMSIKANPGYAWIDGYKYHLWDEGVLDLEMASGNMNRKDSIVLRLDLTNKWIRMFCKTGSYYAGTAIPPAPEISATVHEIVVAHISVAAGTTRITQSMIEDTRMNKEICGWVCGAVEQIDFSQITAQFEGFFSDYRKNISDEFKQFQKNAGDYSEQFVAWVAGKKAEITTWQGKEEEEFDEWVQDFVNKWESWLLGETKGWQEEIIDWFNNLREQLTENAAVSLQEQIGNLNKLETENKDDLVSAINSLLLSYDETMAILAGVKTVTLTMSANDGASVEGKTVTLHNVTTGEEQVMEYSGDVLTFQIKGNEKYRITVGDMEDYVTPDPVDIRGYDSEILEFSIVYRKKTLNDYSWTEIIDLAETGQAEERFNIHDTKELELTTGEKVIVEVVGFNFDTLAEDDQRKASITFATKDCLATEYRMNDNSIRREGIGWETMEMRTTTIREHFYNVLPEDLKTGIKTVKKIANRIKGASGTATENINCADDVWLFSSEETVGYKDRSYPAFVGNPNSAEKRLNGSNKICTYFTRDILAGTGINVDGVICFYMYAKGENGNLEQKFATDKCGMAVGFCV